ncbi:MAG: DUF928 domain-containing protein [Desmonostoc vinosum HA7617-LM4]|nr:DUF928 domain-containing protein [Desmonostoc vinosum HA7617-LM4]
MNIKNKYFCQPSLLGSALLIYLSSMLLIVTPTLAQVTFNPPKEQAPKSSSGGASRDVSTCGADLTATTKASVTPLLPKNNIGLTIAERPTVLIYIPQTNAKTALFSLQDEQNKQYYQTILPLPKKPGVMEVKIPHSVAALKTGKNYQWSLVMICTEELEPDSPWISGWIRRVEANSSLNHQPTLELVSQLAKMGIWYDSLSTLAQLKRSQPNNSAVATSWQELLNSVELNAIANEPLIN